MSQALRRRDLLSQRISCLRCEGCGYVIEEQVIGIGDTLDYYRLCPNCNIESEFGLIPDEFSSARELTDIIDHFYLRGEELKHEARNELVRSMYQYTGREYPIHDLEALARDIQTLGMDDEVSFSLFEHKLGISGDGEALYGILGLFKSYATMPDEYIAIVILTSTLFEVLFAEMVFWLARRKGTTPHDCLQARLDDQKCRKNRKRKEVRTLTLRQYEELFEELTDDHLTFREACSRAGLSEFWEARKYLKGQRNQFLHEGSGAIDEVCAYRAYEFAKNAPQAFAKLQNTYGLISLKGEKG